jgi:hypothetical protein
MPMHAAAEAKFGMAAPSTFYLLNFLPVPARNFSRLLGGAVDKAEAARSFEK